MPIEQGRAGERLLRTLPIPAYPLPKPGWQDSVSFFFEDERSSEPIVDISAYSVRAERYYSRSDGWNWPYGGPIFPNPAVMVRRSVAVMLVAADALLAGEGLELIVLDGLRTLTEQERLWAFFCSALETQKPEMDAASRRALAGSYCYNPLGFVQTTPSTWPVHMTGGSVDVTVARAGTAETMFMGNVFDDPSEASGSAYFEPHGQRRADPLSQSEQLAVQTRRCLWHAMERVGFANYAGEWWHFDFGTALWAHGLSLRGRTEKAFYGLPASEIQVP